MKLFIYEVFWYFLKCVCKVHKLISKMYKYKLLFVYKLNIFMYKLIII